MLNALKKIYQNFKETLSLLDTVRKNRKLFIGAGKLVFDVKNNGFRSLKENTTEDHMINLFFKQIFPENEIQNYPLLRGLIYSVSGK